jgi:hypothetical protein
MQEHTVLDDLLCSQVSGNNDLIVNIRVAVLDDNELVEEQLQKTDVLHRLALVPELEEEFVKDGDLAILIILRALDEPKGMALHGMIEQLGVSTVVKDVHEDLARFLGRAVLQRQLAFSEALRGHVGWHVGVERNVLIEICEAQRGGGLEKCLRVQGTVK